MNTRYTSIAAFLGLVSFSIPFVSSAAPQNLVELVNMLANIFNSGATFLVLLAVIIYLGGVSAIIYEKARGSAKGGAFSKKILWGIVAIFVMVSIWGIIRLLQETLFGTNGGGNGSNQNGSSAPLSFPNSSVL